MIIAFLTVYTVIIVSAIVLFYAAIAMEPRPRETLPASPAPSVVSDGTSASSAIAARWPAANAVASENE
jgi:hypothetical protein